MEIAAQIVGLVVGVLVVTAIARRFDWSEPLCLVLAGVGASFIPGVPDYELHPEVVLLGLLPPLLYATAIRTSLVDIRRNRGPIGLLSVGLVAFTTIGVGLVTWLVIPGLPLAAGLALGAVVAPPDAVAATAVARRVGMPRRIVRILEGESLLNDASALVALRTAIAAIAGSVSLLEVGGDFLLAAGGGILVGLVGGKIAYLLRARMEDPVLDTATSLVVPFAAYLAAEEIHGSGVLAVVIAGLMLGNHEPRMLSGSSRLANRLNWRTIQFLLENLVFLLIGLQLRRILEEAGRSELGIGPLIGVCAAVLAATVLTRIAWMFGIGTIRRLLRGKAWPWSYSAVISWAGMRGVVTLAAAFVLPADTPHRSVLVLAAFVVVAGTLLLQGMTLPRLVRRLGLPPPDPAEDALQEAALLHDMTRAALDELERVRRPEDPEEVVDRLRDRLNHRSDAAWEQLGRQSELNETPSDVYTRLRREMLEAERTVLLDTRKTGRIDDEVLRRVLEALDIEESMLTEPEEIDLDDERELSTPAATAGSCKHLAKAPADTEPETPDGCAECLRDGTSWVHLRLCLTCGHVGCCDSSPARHASAHFHDTRHPVMRSFEPGESWRWCFVDADLG
ncbi:Na+/H+ antiporter [Amycolatopsis magusensis]|uniref:CPA1 family monovalent cation:H+ antiporter n=1 Tax=Amycolatopsis magusensis TaxID=882444 RepID=A0ABS4PJZ3_9PSEU|nr:Na+/H+ antiporter [Amycolatopsis magusensis]MBP2179168.1 CPA1 family monovalent cation:H+ antiporter [Amycolatopsis magusensis]MDI5977531.1 Na+/H+ antiporter [Amycolatopsis magusensis]